MRFTYTWIRQTFPKKDSIATFLIEEIVRRTPLMLKSAWIAKPYIEWHMPRIHYSQVRESSGVQDKLPLATWVCDHPEMH